MIVVLEMSGSITLYSGPDMVSKFCAGRVFVWNQLAPERNVAGNAHDFRGAADHQGNDHPQIHHV
jgi:hypothetical protein